MKKGVLIVVLILLALGLINVGVAKINPKTQLKTTPVPTIDVAQATNYITISEIIKKNKNSTCEVVSPESGNKVKIYLSGKTLRIDTVSGGGDAGHVISQGDWFYIWSNQNKGMKIRTADIMGEEATNSSQRLLESFANVETNSAIKCIDWIPNQQQFELPQGVEFSDFTQQVKDLKPSP
jgi:hypothetical protein